MNEADSLPKFPNGTQLAKLRISETEEKYVYGTAEVLLWLKEQLIEKEAKPFVQKPITWR
jgi:hypothetical protein